MPKTCLTCKAVGSKDVPTLTCGACRSAVYCSEVCQKEDWKEGEHKKICKYLNVGEGAMQVRRPIHMEKLAKLDEICESIERSLDEDQKRFFKLFTESTFEGRQAAAREMKKVVRRETEHNQKALLFNSFCLFARTDSEKLRWRNSPLRVFLKFVDPNVLSGHEHDEKRITLLHDLAYLADPTRSDYSTQENQLTMGRQLIRHGADVNAPAFPNGETPLHTACHSSVTTNLDFIQLLLKEDADPNAQDQLGRTPLMYTTPFAPGAAKFMLEWSNTDVNIIDRSGISFLAVVREDVEHFSNQVALPDNPDRVKDQFVLQQWRDIEDMLVERGGGYRDHGFGVGHCCEPSIYKVVFQ
jgi:hypothetical protein